MELAGSSLPAPPPALAYGGMALVSLAAGMVAYALARAPATPAAPEVGVRGLKRRAARERSPLFAAVEPLVRITGLLVARLPLGGARDGLTRALVHAGDYYGLSADELIAACVLSGVGAFLLGALGHWMAPLTVTEPIVIFATLLGLVAPRLSVWSETARRFKQVNRGLPFAIDLTSLAISAGLDLPGALRQVTDKSPDSADALHEELTRILRELELGYTRRQALEDFAERCPTEPVREFVAAVVQAEQKGNPLSEVLAIQATMLRGRRSVAAEEAAARAGVLMVGPLMMVFGCIVLLILGPFIVQGVTGNGFF